MTEQINTDYIGGGWVCPNCGAWVPPNTYHTCYGTPSTVPQIQSTYTWTSDYSIVLERIAVALERIADRLDAGSK